MDEKGKLSKHDAMMFFNRAWELMAGTPDIEFLELMSYAEEHGVDLDEAMGYVAGAVEKRYYAGGHTDCTRRNVLRIYKFGEPLELDRDHIHGMAVLLSIDLGLLEDYG